MKEKVFAYCKKHSLLSKGDIIIVGVSGGADSMSLLTLLLDFSKMVDFSLRAVYVHHGLRQEADEEAAYLSAFCQQRSIPLHIFREDVKQAAIDNKESIEEAGRIVRRSCFERICKEYGGTKIALGHHLNDNAETLLLNLARGTRLVGMGGILPMKEKWIRPLLCVTKEEIEAYLKEKNIIHFEDASNQSDAFTRNRIRRNVIPYLEESVNSNAVRNIGLAMEQLQEVNQYLEACVEKYFESVVRRDEEHERILLQEEGYRELEELFKGMVIKKGLSTLAGQEKDLTARHVASVKELFEKQVGRSVHLPYHMKGRRVYEGVQLEKCNDEKKSKICVSLEMLPCEIGNQRIEKRILNQNDFIQKVQKKDENFSTQRLNYDIIKDDVFIRTRMQGDYIVIDTKGHRQKLKNYFVNQKIRQSIRDDILLVCEGSRVLWIVGYRVDSTYVPKQDTKTILEIKVAAVDK